MSRSSGVWCFFCNRHFADEVRLIAHQKMHHFKCQICRRVRSTSKDLAHHMSRVHKEILERVPNAVEGRDEPDNNVFGMRGIPEHVYVSWMTSVNPEFRERARDVTLEGAVFANDATRYAVMSHMVSSANVAFGQYNQFQRAPVQVNQRLGTVLTARGLVQSDTLKKEERRDVIDDPAAAQRRYDAAMRRAREVLEEAMEQAIRERKAKVKRERAREVMFFKPVGGLSVYEMRSRFLAEQKGEIE